ncbi:MAG: hypothetical protein P1P63_04860 [Treponemataceae bacterium]
MIIPFKERFVEPILNGSKIHTIRADRPNRWRMGKHIHFATGARTKNYNCFKTGRCYCVQKINIEWKHLNKAVVRIDDKIFGIYENQNRFDYQLQELANNDGFNRMSDFFDFFNVDFEGKIIHWTNFKY